MAQECYTQKCIRKIHILNACDKGFKTKYYALTVAQDIPPGDIVDHFNRAMSESVVCAKDFPPAPKKQKQNRGTCKTLDRKAWNLD